MIQLDEHHWIKDADEVKAIRPVLIYPPESPIDPNRREPIVDPDRCLVLIGDDWITIERGGSCIANFVGAG